MMSSLKNRRRGNITYEEILFPLLVNEQYITVVIFSVKDLTQRKNNDDTYLDKFDPPIVNSIKKGKVGGKQGVQNNHAGMLTLI